MTPRSPLAVLGGPTRIAGGAVALGAIVVVGLFASFLRLLFGAAETGSTGLDAGFDVRAVWTAAKLLVGGAIVVALGAVVTAARRAARSRDRSGDDERPGDA